MESNGTDEKTGSNGELGTEKEEVGSTREDGDESEWLLPSQNGEISRGSPKRVQWNDAVGNKLAEVLLFDASDASDSDDEESDSCFCTIM